jgi:hypothetical protein
LLGEIYSVSNPIDKPYLILDKERGEPHGLSGQDQSADMYPANAGN